MDIKQLRYFLGILEAKSVTKAAETLKVAQPALGLQIRNLERELGVQLLVRHARGVSPTEAGVLLARHAEAIVHLFDRAHHDLLDYGRNPRGRVSLGLSHTAARVLAGAVVARCRQRLPAVQLAITEGLSSQLLTSVAADTLDLALLYHCDGHAELHRKPLIEESLVCVRPAGSPLPPTLSLDELFANELIVPSRPHVVREMVEAAAKAAGKAVRVYCEVDAVSSMIELVSGGLAATLLPECAVQGEIAAGRVQVQRIDTPNFRRTLYLVRDDRRPHSKAMTAVSQEVEDLVQELARKGAVGWSPLRPGARSA